MHGQITKFRRDLGVGVIHSEDGRRYRFARTQIQNPNGKLVGYDVDFLVESNRAENIFLMCGSPWTAFGAVSQD